MTLSSDLGCSAIIIPSQLRSNMTSWRIRCKPARRPDESSYGDMPCSVLRAISFGETPSAARPQSCAQSGVVSSPDENLSVANINHDNHESSARLPAGDRTSRIDRLQSSPGQALAWEGIRSCELSLFFALPAMTMVVVRAGHDAFEDENFSVSFCLGLVFWLGGDAGRVVAGLVKMLYHRALSCGGACVGTVRVNAS